MTVQFFVDISAGRGRTSLCRFKGCVFEPTVRSGKEEGVGVERV